MTSLLLLLLIIISITAAPVDENPVSDESNDVELPKRLAKKLDNTKDTIEPDKTKQQLPQKIHKASKKGRLHKAFLLNYPYAPQINRYSTVPNYDENYNDFIEERTSGNRRKYPDSDIFYIRLPPTPYFFVPGLGYISNPPKFTAASLKPQMRPQRPSNHHKHQQNSFINLPIDFVSNGKPTGVYQYEPSKKPSKRKDSTVSKLKKGPYGFNGRPTSIYVLSPDGEESFRQPIIYSDLNGNKIV